MYAARPLRSLRGLLATLLLTLLPAAGWAQEAPPEALLLGFRYDQPLSAVPPYYAGGADSLARSAYHTLFIVQDEGRVTLTADREGLLVPRPTGFWRVTAKRSIYNDWVEDFILAAPLGRQAPLAGIQPFNGEYCRGSRLQKITYAGEDYLALEQYSAGYCEGAAHPWIFNTLAFVPMDSTTHLGLDVQEVLGEGAWNVFEAATNAFNASRAASADSAFYPEQPDPASWGLIHRQGRWRLQGRLEAMEAPTAGRYVDLPLSLPVPAALAGRNVVTPDWAAIRAFAPDAVDAFSSPSGDLLVILRPGRLTVHPVRSGRIAPAMLSTRLRPNAQPVMARWATGTRVARWRARVLQLGAGTTATRR